MLIQASIFWSLSGVLVKGAAWNAWQMSVVCASIGALVQHYYLRKVAFKITPTQFFAAICYSLLLISALLALTLTTAANAILLQFASPVYVALLERYLFGNKILRSDLYAMIAVFFGIGLFFVDKVSLEGTYGNVIALASGLFAAGLSMTLKYGDKTSMVQSLYLGNLLTVILCCPLAFPLADFNISSLALISLSGFLGSGLAWILYCHALDAVSAIRALIITTLEAILNPVWVWIFLAEVPGFWSIIGGTIVLIAITIYGVKSPVESNLSKQL